MLIILTECVIVALKILSNQYSHKNKNSSRTQSGVVIQADLRTARTQDLEIPKYGGYMYGYISAT